MTQPVTDILLASSAVWPQPVRDLVRWSTEARSEMERHKCIYLALEASMRVGFAALPADLTVGHKLSSPSVGDWGRLLAAGHDRAIKAGTSAFDTSFLRDHEVHAAVASLKSGQPIRKALALNVLFGAIAEHRNRKIAHSGMLRSEEYAASAEPLAAILVKGWLAGLFLPIGARLSSEAIEGVGDLQSIKLQTEAGESRPLDPWVFESTDGWLFFDRRTGKSSSYLNYLGDAVTTKRFGAVGEAIEALITERIGVPDSEPTPASGTARYRVLWPIGSGGMGRLFLAVDQVDGRHVVMKRALQEDDKVRLQHRLTRETELLERLADIDTPGVVRYVDRFDDEGPVLVMNFVEGCTLADFGYGLDQGDSPEQAPQRRAARTVAPGRFEMPPSTRSPAPSRDWSRDFLLTYLQVLRDTARALGPVHEAGIFHNDLTPTNIMVRRSPTGVQPVLIDFGIAKEVDTETQLTGIGGTAGFSAPEVKTGAWSARSDVYSLGAVLDAELLQRRYRTQGMSRGELAYLERLVSRCRQTDPARRPSSVTEVATALTHLLEGRVAATARQMLFVGVVGAAMLVGVALLALPRQQAKDGGANGLQTPQVAISSPQQAQTAPPGPTTQGAAAASAANDGETACLRWISAAELGKFDGEAFKEPKKSLAKAIVAGQLGVDDLNVDRTGIPCNTHDKAIKMYVAAALAPRSVAAWSGNRFLKVAADIKDAMREDPSRVPEETRKAVQSNVTKLTQKARLSKNTFDEQRAVRACDFARAVRLDSGIFSCTAYGGSDKVSK